MRGHHARVGQPVWSADLLSNQYSHQKLASSETCYGSIRKWGALHSYLLKPASSYSFASGGKYEETLALAKRTEKTIHRVIFTHGDSKEHNILVDEDDNLTGWLDWNRLAGAPSTRNPRRHAGEKRYTVGRDGFELGLAIVTRMSWNLILPSIG